MAADGVLDINLFPIIEINDGMNEFNVNITGCTPRSITDSLLAMRTANIFTPLAAKILIRVGLLSTSIKRTVVEAFIGRQNDQNFTRIINDVFLINNRLNFNSLSLFGHMLLYYFPLTGVELAARIRDKLGSSSIWNMNPRLTKVSGRQLEILMDKSTKVNIIMLNECRNDFVGLFRA